MGVPTSGVSYAIAATRRETTKVHKNMWRHWKKKSNNTDTNIHSLFEECLTVRLHHEIKWNANLTQQCNYWSFFSSTCFRRIRPSSGALDVKSQRMVFCTQFVDGWWSWEPLRRSCVRFGWCLVKVNRNNCAQHLSYHEFYVGFFDCNATRRHLSPRIRGITCRKSVIFKSDDLLPDLSQTWEKRFLVRAHFSFKSTRFFTLATLLHRTVDCKTHGFTKSGCQISLLYVTYLLTYSMEQGPSWEAS